MTTINKQNINVTSINALIDNDTNILSNITINNTVKIPKSSLTTSNAQTNADACIYIKDVNSSVDGEFYPLKIDSLEHHPTPYMYFNQNLVIDSSNFISELESLLSDYPLDTSNITVAGGYINFFNGTTITNINQGATGVGLRYTSDNHIQFKNDDAHGWINLVDILHYDEFKELFDVDVQTNPLLNNQYITYNSTSTKFVNSNLAISNDANPILSNNLIMGNYSLLCSNTTNNLIYSKTLNTINVQNPYISFENTTTTTGICNYLTISNAGHDDDTLIKCSGSDSNVGVQITTKGAGSITLNADAGIIDMNTDAIHISGFVKNSIYRTSTHSPPYTPSTSWTIPLNTDTILFDFDNTKQTGTYWANVSAGIDGQKLNLIYNKVSTNSNIISVLAGFGTNKLITGSGYTNGLIFETTGQSTTLIYLGSGINAWQVLNTGAGIF